MRLIIDQALIAEVEKYQGAEVHDVTNLLRSYQDAAHIENAILDGGKRYTSTDFRHMFEWAERLLRQYVARKRLEEPVTIRQLREEIPYKAVELWQEN